MSAKNDVQKSTGNTAVANPTSDGFSADEKDAMRVRANELKAQAREGKSREAGEKAVLEKIAEFSEPDHSMAERIHAIVKTSAPDLIPRTWYGMPAYSRNDEIVCFFQPAARFKTRYATLGFNDSANLDDGSSWPTAYALKELTPAVEAKIADLIKKAVS